MITTNCPIPFSDFDCVLLAHGGGGRMTRNVEYTRRSKQ